MAAHANASDHVIELLHQALTDSGLGGIDLVLQPSGERRRLPLE